MTDIDYANLIRQMNEAEFLEQFFGIKLLDYQKELLNKWQYQEPLYYIRFPRRYDYLYWLREVTKWALLNESNN